MGLVWFALFIYFLYLKRKRIVTSLRNMKIVFVYTGNASRSAVAEVVLKKMLADNGIDDVDVASCGTKVPDSLYREDVMCRIAAEHGYDSHWDRIVRFNDYCFRESSDLSDSHYQTEHVYRTCFDTIVAGCKEIIKKLNKSVATNVVAEY